MASAVDTNGDSVPEVLFEAYFKTNNGNVVHVRVHGEMWNFTSLLEEFRRLCDMHRYSGKGSSYGF